ncbi:hypothetical protein ASC94_20305 [Massilia sp. Root418]|nr:hypothetical protein ASC94_20305 [Massilia sp. Root418]
MRPALSITLALIAALAAGGLCAAHASDHLDSPQVIADPRLDIGDLYAWTAANGRQLNLAMTIVGHSFSRDAEYAFHIDSARRFGAMVAGSTTGTSIVCRFGPAQQASCRLANGADNDHLQVFAGPRDDPFFNNVKGSRDAFNYAAALLRNGTPRDAAGCPQFSAVQAGELLQRWRHTAGGPAQNFLAGWTSSAIVVTVDLEAVNQGGPLLAVWADTSLHGRRIDRAGRPLTGNALLAPLEADDISDALKLKYNEATPATAAEFISHIAQSLALYDGYDGECGNQLLADTRAAPTGRYTALATLLADDRLWVNSASTTCTQLFAVELAAIRPASPHGGDCGGRALDYDAVNVYRSLLAAGANTGIDDGVHADDSAHSNTVFPFMAAPQP